MTKPADELTADDAPARPYPDTPPTPPPPRANEKFCAGCNNNMPREFFGSDPSKRDGLAGKCKSCTAEKMRGYRKKRRAEDPAFAEREREVRRDWAKTPRGKLDSKIRSAAKAELCRRHPEELSDLTARFRLEMDV